MLTHHLTHHLNRHLTETQRRRWTDLLVDSADAVGLPDDAEFRASFMSYIEWGTRLAILFSAPGATPNLDEPVPQWRWVLPPWQPDATEPSTDGATSREPRLRRRTTSGVGRRTQCLRGNRSLRLDVDRAEQQRTAGSQ